MSDMQFRLEAPRRRKSQIEALGRQIEIVIEESEDPKGAMDVIAEVAERRGLIDTGSLLRRDSPQSFVMDLWTENPLLPDLLNLQPSLPSPLKLRDLPSVLDALP